MVCDFVCVKYIVVYFEKRKEGEGRYLVGRGKGKGRKELVAVEKSAVLCESFLDGLHCIG